MLSQPFRLLLADDHKIVRRGLRSLLEDYSDLIVVGDVDGFAVAEAAAATCPDVILFDVRAPRHEDGLKSITQICRKVPDARIVVCTVAEDTADLTARAFEAGAVGFLSKTRCDAREVAAAIRIAARAQVFDTTESTYTFVRLATGQA